MNILFWVPYPTEGASNRYRVEQFLPYLKKNNIQYRLRPFWSSPAFKILYAKGKLARKICYFIAGTLRRLIDLCSLWRYDIVFIHRESFPLGGATFERFALLWHKPIIYDFDDAIFLPSVSTSNSFIERFKDPGKVATIIKYSSHIITGNEYLADFARHFNKHVIVIPTSFDTDTYAPSPKTRKETITIGWIGSPTTLAFLEPLKTTMITLAQRFPNVRFKIVGGELNVPNCPSIINKPWNLTEEISDVRSFDIGIMPMPDNAWTKGKCGFKAILCMSMAIPCVCSPVGVNTEIIREGFNGYLATSDAEWTDKLSTLIQNDALREKIGAQARITVEKNYSLQITAPQFIGILKES